MFLLIASSAALAAQTKTPPTPKPAVQHAPAAAGSVTCTKLPAISPKIPALPAGSACFKPLYTIDSTPPVKVNDASAPVVASVIDYFGFGPTIVSLSYVDTRIGTGAPAALHKWYSVKYTGYLVDGTVFDSSDSHPDHAPFVLQQGAHKVIPGWDTGFYGMRVGGKRRLFIPHQLAYGPRANGAVPANADLIFDIELVSQSDKDPTPPPASGANAGTPTFKAIPGTPMGTSTNPAPSNAAPPTARPVPAPPATTTPGTAAPPATAAPATTPPATTAPKPQ
jgi:peptidylprolyl isomerase